MMFKTAELGQTLSKSDYQEQVPKLRTEILRVQEELKAAPFPVLILVSGVDGAGKGRTVNLLHHWMDARYLHTYGFGPPTDDERRHPAYWRFWMALPPKGRIGIFFGSWYTDPIVSHVNGASDDEELTRAIGRIKAFEQLLADDGMLIIKLWFHLSKSQQQNRLTELESDRDTRWRVTKQDWQNFKLYDKFRETSGKVLQGTDTGDTPWMVVEGADPRHREVTVANHIINSIQDRLTQWSHRTPATPKPPAETRVPTEPTAATVLDQLDLSLELPKKRYEKQLQRLQGKLNRQSRKVQKRHCGVLLAVEGWDAGGKGGAIRRMTAALDARQYRVIPIAAPTDEERMHHYLWRFARHIPSLGRFTIFDRSWYGRVLVERVEGFAAENEWQRAYHEINAFESHITDRGWILLKYWVHISKDEQLRRFQERERIPWKKFKITEEDYRNRQKWDHYEVAANEMIGRTNSAQAPWILIEGNDKYYARIKLLKTLTDALDDVLKKKS